MDAAKHGSNHLPAFEGLHKECQKEHAKERTREKSRKEEGVLEETPLLRCRKERKEHA